MHCMPHDFKPAKMRDVMCYGWWVDGNEVLGWGFWRWAVCAALALGLHVLGGGEVGAVLGGGWQLVYFVQL